MPSWAIDFVNISSSAVGCVNMPLKVVGYVFVSYYAARVRVGVIKILY